MTQAISAFLASAFSFILGCYVFASNPRNLVNILFSILVFLNAVYALLLGLLLTVPSFQDSWLFPRLLYAVPALIPVSFYGFCRVFPDTPASFDPRRFFMSHLPIASAMVFLSLAKAVITGTSQTPLGIRPTYGPLFILYIVYFVTYLTSSLIVLVRKYRYSSGLTKTQFVYAFLGLIPSFIAVILATLVLPALGIKYFSQTGPLFTIPMVAVIGYAIVRYRLMDVTLVIRRTILVFLYILFVTLALQLYLNFSISRYIFGKASSVYFGEVLFWCIGIALFAYYLNSILEAILDKYVFSGRYNYKASLKKISEDLVILSEFDEVLRTLSTSLKNLLNLKKIIIAVKGIPFEYDICVVQQPEADEALIKKKFEEIRHLLSETGELAVFEEMKRKVGWRKTISSLDLFRELDVGVLVGLQGKGQVNGFIALGSKGSGDLFSKDDLDFLVTLANQGVVAIENSRLYSQILIIKEYTERIFEQLTCGVVTVNNAGALTVMNAKAKDLLGLRGSAFSPQTVYELPGEIGDVILQSMSSQTTNANIEIHFEIQEQPSRFLNLTTAPLRGPKGETIGALAVLTDLTEIKLLEAEVRRAERLATVGTLAAGMAHEIKNPLVSLKTFAQLLPIKYDDPEFRESFSHIAAGEIERINSLVEQLLRFARPPKPIPMPIDLHDPIEQTLALLSSEMAKKGIKITTKYYQTPLWVFADAEQLKQVFMNVLLNALEATSSQEEPSLEISTGTRKRWGWPPAAPFAKLPQGYTQGDREAYVRIADNGPGIRESHIKHIFDPFFTTKHTGHGLGLSIAHGIVREHKGSINAENRPGGGAVFTIALPLLVAEAALPLGDSHELRADRLA